MKEVGDGRMVVEILESDDCGVSCLEYFLFTSKKKVVYFLFSNTMR